MAQRHSTVLEGIIAGVLGATVVALWFFIVDVIARHPLHKPQLLGAALFSILGPMGSESPAWYVVTYTVVHYALFIAVGLIATAVIHAAHRQPAVLAGAFILFVALELAFYVFVSLLAHTLLRELAWYSVAIGNLLAAIAMGTYLWRRHPGLRENLSHALSGEEHRNTGEKPSTRVLQFRTHSPSPSARERSRRHLGQ